MVDMKIVSVIENKADGDLVGEHGLSVYIEFNGKRYLLDTGSSDKFLGNADKLGIDVGNIDASILSHSHFDHSKGYDGFFAKNNRAKLYARKEARVKCYAKVGLIKKYVGVPKNLFTEHGSRVIFVDGDYKIDEGVWLIPHKTEGLEQRGKNARMYTKSKRGFSADNFAHEQSLVFDLEDGLVILNSCCHGGVDNIVAEVKETFNNKEVLAVIGGFHLMSLLGVKTMSCKPEEVRELAERLIHLGVKKIYTGHCTGEIAYKILEEELGSRLEYFKTGTTIEF